MNDESAGPTALTGLESDIRALYQGPLEDFVARRDALVKQARASGKRDDAARVKALRKPSRAAWALDAVFFEDPAPIEQLAAAITAAQAAHSSGGTSVRTALETVRNAVRAIAHAAAREAIRGGHPIEATSLTAAVHAVIGDARAFADLRAGRLTEIPEGGGLDILTAITASTPPVPSIGVPGKQSEPRGEPDARDAERVAAARAELLRTEASLAAARERLHAAERTVLNAQAKLDAAEQRLRHAQEEAETRRAEHERARQDAASATLQVADAERAVANARARVM